MIQLLPFQKEAVSKMLAFLKSDIKGCYNACEMRLGKTIQTIHCLNELKCKRILIVCPLIAKGVWRDHLEKYFAGDLTIFSVDSMVDFEEASKHPVVLCHYDIISRGNHYEPLAKQRWDALVCDESHRLKASKAKVTKAILKDIWPCAKYHIALSGTPCTKNIIDAFTLFNKFLPDTFPDFYSFAHTFTNVHRTPWADKYVGIKNEDSLKKIIYNKFFVRYRRSEIEHDLPEKVYQKISLGKEYLLAQTVEEKKAHEDYVQKIRQAFASGAHVMPVPPVSVMTTLRLQGKAKVKAIVEIAEEYLDQGIPIVIFMVHLEAIYELSNELKKYLPSVITGNVSTSDRSVAISNFQHGCTDIFIGQIQASGLAIDLSRSTTCIIGEFHYSPAIVKQAVARCEKMNQKSAIHIIYPVVEKSVEEDVIHIMMEKLESLEKAFDN